MNFLDKVVTYISPERGKRRQIFRDDLEKTEKRKYEGAAITRRTSNWLTSGTSANNENQYAISTLRNRARDLIRNDPYAAKGVNVIATSLVGTGILPHITNDAVSDIWQEWTKTTAIDYDGQLTLAGMQKLVARSMVGDGEILFRKRIVPNDPIFPLKIQLLEADFLPTDRVTSEINKTKNRVIQGVEINSKNRIVAYHLYDSHPGGVAEELLTSSLITHRIPAKEMGHVYRMDRAGQVRGPSWFAPIMIKLFDFNQFEDAELMRQKISALYTGFVKDIDPQEPDDDDIQQDCTMEPGTITSLPPGRDIVFNDPPRPDNYPEYVSTVLHSIATGLGITYESLTSDLSQVNFSSARMGWLQMDANIKSWRNDIINPKFNDKIYRWFLETLPAATGMSIPSDVSPIVDWIAPRREMIDPTKEVPAKIKEIRAGLITLSEAVMESGHRPDVHFQKAADDFNKIEELGLVLDSDPRVVDGQGAQQQNEGTDDSSQTGQTGEDES